MVKPVTAVPVATVDVPVRAPRGPVVLAVVAVLAAYLQMGLVRAPEVKAVLVATAAPVAMVVRRQRLAVSRVPAAPAVTAVPEVTALIRWAMKSTVPATAGEAAMAAKVALVAWVAPGRSLVLFRVRAVRVAAAVMPARVELDWLRLVLAVPVVMPGTAVRVVPVDRGRVRPMAVRAVAVAQVVMLAMLVISLRSTRRALLMVAAVAMAVLAVPAVRRNPELAATAVPEATPALVVTVVVLVAQESTAMAAMVAQVVLEVVAVIPPAPGRRATVAQVVTARPVAMAVVRRRTRTGITRVATAATAETRVLAARLGRVRKGSMERPVTAVMAVTVAMVLVGPTRVKRAATAALGLTVVRAVTVAIHPISAPTARAVTAATVVTVATASREMLAQAVILATTVGVATVVVGAEPAVIRVPAVLAAAVAMAVTEAMGATLVMAAMGPARRRKAPRAALGAVVVPPVRAALVVPGLAVSAAEPVGSAVMVALVVPLAMVAREVRRGLKAVLEATAGPVEKAARPATVAPQEMEVSAVRVVPAATPATQFSLALQGMDITAVGAVTPVKAAVVVIRRRG